MFKNYLNTSIRRRFFLGVGGLFVFFVTIGWLLNLGFQRLVALEEALEVHTVKLAQAYPSDVAPRAQRESTFHYNEALQLLDRLTETIDDEERRQLAAEVKSQFKNVYGSGRELNQGSANLPARGSPATDAGQLEVAMRQLLERSRQMFDRKQEEAYRESESLIALGKLVFILVIGSLLVFSVFTFVIVRNQLKVIAGAFREFSPEDGDGALDEDFDGLGEVAVAAVGLRAKNTEVKSFNRELEQRVEERTRQLEMTNSFLDSIVENLPLMVFIKDAKNLRFLRVNKAAEEIIGSSRSDLIGKSDYDFFPADQAEFFVNKDREVLASSSVIDIQEEELTSAAGTRILHTLKVPILGADGEPEYLLGISTDITESKKIQDELRRTTQAAEIASKAKSQFLANMSHELRTPLNAIIGYSELLSEQESIVEDEEALVDLKRIMSSGRHLLSLIDDILDISKIEAGRMDVELVATSVTLLLDEIISVATRQLEKNSNVLTVDCPDSVGSIYTDRIRLKQALLNLLNNAGKFTEEGEISLVGRRYEHEIIFTVSDTGIGMNPDQQRQLFEPFVQADSSTTRKFGGTGLGLAITKGIVEQLKGEIELTRSAPGEGTSIEIRLPVQQGSD